MSPLGQRTNPLRGSALRAEQSQWHRWSDEVSGRTDLSASKTDFRCNPVTPVTGHPHTRRSRRFSADNKLERRSNNVPIRKLRQRNLTKLEKGRNQASSRSYV